MGTALKCKSHLCALYNGFFSVSSDEYNGDVHDFR